MAAHSLQQPLQYLRERLAARQARCEPGVHVQQLMGEMFSLFSGATEWPSSSSCDSGGGVRTEWEQGQGQGQGHRAAVPNYTLPIPSPVPAHAHAEHVPTRNLPGLSWVCSRRQDVWRKLIVSCFHDCIYGAGSGSSSRDSDLPFCMERPFQSKVRAPSAQPYLQ